MTREEYFTKSLPRPADAPIRLADPALFADADPEPFMPGLTIRISRHGAAVYDGETMIGSMCGKHDLVVDENYRGRGIGTNIVIAWYRRHPEFSPVKLNGRTAAGQAAVTKAWEVLKREVWPDDEP